MASKYIRQLELTVVVASYTSVKIIPNMDVGMHHAKNRGSKESP